jgi:hypothetical protein
MTESSDRKKNSSSVSDNPICRKKRRSVISSGNGSNKILFIVSKIWQMIKKTFYKTKDYCKVKFTIDVKNAKTVSVHGLNGNWHSPLKMKQKKDGSFTAEEKLPIGSQHEFKYLVNKTDWINDPEADGEKPNEFGGINSLLRI